MCAKSKTLTCFMSFTLGNRAGITRISKAMHAARPSMTWNQVSKWGTECYHARHRHGNEYMNFTFQKRLPKPRRFYDTLLETITQYTSIRYFITSNKHKLQVNTRTLRFIDKADLFLDHKMKPKSRHERGSSKQLGQVQQGA